MNKDQAKGKLDRAKGTAKKAWGNVTDDDAKKADGSKDKLHGAIQEKYGDAKAAINKNVDKVR
ncbi:MAG: general stress protein CsbD [Deltaproteobacteria bacterium RIFOXYA12_FULL_58_15]|nr:MAG: general stress protein CsbD [Deltaproteobacteria bacterium RIFOXYA12_FULL_58_15]